jgi:hypothetical protein
MYASETVQFVGLHCPPKRYSIFTRLDGIASQKGKFGRAAINQPGMCLGSDYTSFIILQFTEMLQAVRAYPVLTRTCGSENRP